MTLEELQNLFSGPVKLLTKTWEKRDLNQENQEAQKQKDEVKRS